MTTSDDTEENIMKIYMKDIRYTPTMKNRERYFGDIHGRDIMKWVNKYFTQPCGHRYEIMEIVEDLRKYLPSVSYAVLAKIAFSLDCLIADIHGMQKKKA